MKPKPRKQNDWIKVWDALPKPDVRVLVYSPDLMPDGRGIGMMHSGEWILPDCRLILVTHWQPLPEGPE